MLLSFADGLCDRRERAEAHAVGEVGRGQRLGLLKSEARVRYTECLGLEEAAHEVLNEVGDGRTDLERDGRVFEEQSVAVEACAARVEAREGEELEASSVRGEAFVMQTGGELG